MVKLLPNAKISAHLGKIAISKFRCSVCSINLREHPVYLRVGEILLEKLPHVSFLSDTIDAGKPRKTVNK